MILTPVKYDEKILKEIMSKSHLFELKYNGVGVELSSTGGKWNLLVNRSNKDITHKFKFLLDQIPVIPDSILGGEIIYKEHDQKVESFNKAMSIISSSSNYEPILADLLKTGQFKLIIYFATRYKGQDLSNKTYREIRDVYTTIVKSINKPNIIDISEEIKIRDVEHMWKEITDRGIEGFVAKSLDDKFTSGNAKGKTKSMVKVKKFETQDLVVYDYFYPDKGTKGVRRKIAVKLGLFDKNGKIKHITNLSNFSEQDEKTIKEKIDKKQIFVIEVQYMERTTKSLLVPRFIRFRFDYNPYECTIEEETIKKSGLVVDIMRQV